MINKIKLILLVSLACATNSFAEPKGWGLGFGTFESDFGVQARKDFAFGQERQFEAVVQAGLYNQNRWTGRFDADFHYIFAPTSNLRLYPLVGIDWALQKKHNRAGINMGGGMMIDLNSATRLFVEGKYVAGDWDGLALTFGLYF